MTVIKAMSRNIEFIPADPAELSQWLKKSKKLRSNICDILKVRSCRFFFFPWQWYVWHLILTWPLCMLVPGSPSLIFLRDSFTENKLIMWQTCSFTMEKAGGFRILNFGECIGRRLRWLKCITPKIKFAVLVMQPEAGMYFCKSIFLI